MSSFFYRYSEYVQTIYNVLVSLAVVAVVLVAGWYLIKYLYSRHPLRDLYQWLYLAGCAGIYLGLVAWFVR